MNTVLIVGASGLVGSALFQEFRADYKVTGTFFRNHAPNLNHLDLRDPVQVRELVGKLRPDLILCPAAESNVELCEIDPVATRQVNVGGLRNLVAATKEVGALLVYFSSEYVFDGARGSYSETDACNPLNEYGRQKLDCERLIANELGRHLIARISGVYGWESRKMNFVVRFVECLEEGQFFKVPSDQIITPTFAPNLARAIRRLVEHDRNGIFHLSGSVPLPRVEFAYLIAEVFNLERSLVAPVPTSEMKLRATRPRSAGLKVQKAEALLDFPLMPPREGLEAMKMSRPFPELAGPLASSRS